MTKPNYNGVKTEPGLLVIVADFRFIVPDDEWVKTTRHKVMYKDESKID
ncbi:MAG: hypothetical protein M3550_13765 [Actinomycetota bacterium]|nr:hypothetical protein [Actinomycetota bacterium]